MSNDKNEENEENYELRQKAERLIDGQELETMSTKDIKSILHELHVYQIELDMQNNELRLSQIELAKTRDRYQNLYDFAPDGYITLGLENTIVETYLTFCDMLGINRLLILNKKITDFILKEDQDKYYLVSKLVMSSMVKQTKEIRFSKKDGSDFSASLEIVAQGDHFEKFSNIRITLTDVTLQRKTEKELHKMQKLEGIGLMAGGIAHDFNNILTSLFSNISLAKKELQNNHPGYEYLKDAERSMSDAKKLTLQFLTFAKGGAPIKSDTNLAELIKESLHFNLTGSNVKPKMNVGKDLWIVQVDKGQIQQLLSNLIINAKQAMPNGGHLFLTLENQRIPEGLIKNLVSRNYIKITIKDEGIGIDPSDLEKVFDPYFTTKKHGHGLGLTTAYSIIEKHGGHMSVESQLHKGTLFTMYLPASRLLKLSEQLNPKSPQLKTPAPGSLERILVMDDQEMILNSVKKLLEGYNYIVDIVLSGEEAIAAYKQSILEGHPFDVIIMNLTVPGGIGGEEAVKEVLKMNNEAKVVVSSGYTEDLVMKNYKDFGFKGALQKPFLDTNLLKVIQQAINA
jgi:PAS domain S-box-containing protein